MCCVYSYIFRCCSVKIWTSSWTAAWQNSWTAMLNLIATLNSWSYPNCYIFIKTMCSLTRNRKVTLLLEPSPVCILYIAVQFPCQCIGAFPWLVCFTDPPIIVHCTRSQVSMTWLFGKHSCLVVLAKRLPGHCGKVPMTILSHGIGLHILNETYCTNTGYLSVCYVYKQVMGMHCHYFSYSLWSNAVSRKGVI